MRSPLSPEAVAQMVADRQAGTPGPWRFDGPVWNQIVWKDGDTRLCYMAHSNGLNDDRDIANASRIARLPNLEAAYLTLAAENAALRTQLAERDATCERLREGEANLSRLLNENARAEFAEAELATLRASEAAAQERVTQLECGISAAMSTAERRVTVKQDGQEISDLPYLTEIVIIDANAFKAAMVKIGDAK